MNRSAFRLCSSMRTWIRTLAQPYQEQPEPPGRHILLELDEMRHHVQKKRQKCWIWGSRGSGHGAIAGLGMRAP
jgi:hypothetical protein